MATEILKSYGSLQSALEEAKSSLKGVDENIKRLIGRDPSELPTRPGAKRGAPHPQFEDKPKVRNVRNYPHEIDEPLNKRRNNNNNLSVFKRLSDRPMHLDEGAKHKQMISKVIVTPKEVPSRQDALNAESKDEKSKARNRRMFGALLGTLQKFQQEETKLKKKEDKRAQLEKKIEEHEIKEKQEIRKERHELFMKRRQQQAEIKMIELKMVRMQEYATWEERQKPRGNFILTKAKPHIHFLPRKLNEQNKALLETSKVDIEKLIEKRRTDIFSELEQIEERMKKNFESKTAAPVENVQENTENTCPFEEDEDVEMVLAPQIEVDAVETICVKVENVKEVEVSTNVLEAVKEEHASVECVTEDNQQSTNFDNKSNGQKDDDNQSKESV